MSDWVVNSGSGSNGGDSAVVTGDWWLERWAYKSGMKKVRSLIRTRATGNSRLESEKFPPFSEKFPKIPVV